jgi:hypothetical protein
MPSRFRRERGRSGGNEQGARLSNGLTQQIDERVANVWVGDAIGGKEEIHNLPVSCDKAFVAGPSRLHSPYWTITMVPHGVTSPALGYTPVP